MSTAKENLGAPGRGDMGRREFIKMAGIAAASAFNLSLNKNPESSQSIRSESLADILDEIKSEYGIYIPRSEGEFIQYQVCQGQNNSIVTCGKEERSTLITQEEAETIQESLHYIPSPGKFVQLFILFRNASSGTIGGGSAMGRNWEYFLDPAKYQTYPSDKYVSPLSAIKIVLSDKKLCEKLPPVTQTSNFLPLLSEALLNEMGVNATNKVDYPWTTYGERLRQVIPHEIAHEVSAYAGNMKVNNDPKADNEASAISLFGGIPLDTYHPILASFGPVNGWRHIPYGDFLAQWGALGRQMSEELKRKFPRRADWPVWDRDPKVWGPLENRIVRLDPYSSYGTIAETFAGFFSFYSRSRVDKRYDTSLLTPGEISYFDRVFHGLSVNPDRYIRDLIRENPGPAYNRNLFEDKTRTRRLNLIENVTFPHQADLLEIKSGYRRFSMRQQRHLTLLSLSNIL